MHCCRPIVWVAWLILIAWAGTSLAADSVTITTLDSSKGIVTVRNNSTGELTEIPVGEPKLLSELKVGQVIDPPKDAEVHTRAMRPPLTKSSSSCLQQCTTSGTLAQCVYYCGFIR